MQHVSKLLSMFLLAALTCSVQGQAKYAPLPLIEGEQKLFSEAIGRSLYLCGTAELTGVNATGEGEQLELKWGARLPPLAFPHPVPLPIVAVGKVGEYDHTKIWGIRLKLGENRFAVLRVAAKDDELSPTAKDSLAFLVEKANGDSLLNPVSLAESHSFNTHELSAIQHGYVDRGISEKAVICAIGIPEQINDYGRAGRQLVYNSGNLLVYIDSTGYVEEIHKSY